MLRAPLIRSGSGRRLLALLGTTFASLLLLSGAQSGVQAPGAGWYSGNPLLGPSTLTSLASAGRNDLRGGETKGCF
jgi:hypothetical protein